MHPMRKQRGATPPGRTREKMCACGVRHGGQCRTDLCCFGFQDPEWIQKQHQRHPISASDRLSSTGRLCWTRQRYERAL